MLSSRSRLPMFVPPALGVLIAAGPLGCDSPDQAPVRAPVAIAEAGTDSATPGAWTAYPTGPTGLSSTLAAVWGSSASDVYAVGYFPGAIVHSLDEGAVDDGAVDQGATWSIHTFDARTFLRAVSGSGPGDVYAVGNRTGDTPIVMHTADRGTTWQSSDLPFDGQAHGVWSSGPKDTYVVGSSGRGPSGVILHTSDEGATWVLSVIDGVAAISAIWGTGPNDIYVAGARKVVPNGGPPDAGDRPDASLTDASPNDAGAARDDAAADDASAPIYEGIVLHSSDGARSWTVLTTTPSGALFAIGGSPDGARIDAVGQGYTMTESIDHGATWLQHAGSSDHGAGAQLTAVWVRSASEDPYIANEKGLIRQIDGVEPDAITSQYEKIPLSFVAGVWGIGRDVYAVGGGGKIAHEVASH